MPTLRAAASTAAVVLLGPALAGCGAFGAADESDSCRDLEVTISGTDGKDRLVGTSGHDVIAGRGGDDRILGMGGDDVLCGGPGADRIDGGEGDDVVDGGTDRRDTVDTESYEWAGDTLVGGRGDDRIVAGPTGTHGAVDTLSYVASPGPVRADLRAARVSGDGEDRLSGRFLTLLGTEGDDVLLGSDRGEQVNGGLGADRIEGRGGNDRLQGAGVPRVVTTRGEGIDLTSNVLLGGEGDDEIQGGQGDDRIEGGPGKDNLAGDDGTDRVLGGPGDDSLNDLWPAPGKGRTDLLDGGPGRDRMDISFLLRPGSPPQDPAVLRDGVGTIDLAAGGLRARAGGLDWRIAMPRIEDVLTPYGTWTVLGTDGPNEVIAGDEKRPVVVRARGGDDHLAGSFRDDLLDGGPGRDTAIPYVGRDRLVSIEKTIR